MMEEKKIQKNVSECFIMSERDRASENEKEREGERERERERAKSKRGVTQQHYHVKSESDTNG